MSKGKEGAINRKTLSRAKKAIYDCLVKNDVEPESIEWEPIGPCFEMMGHSGGWLVNYSPIGLNLSEAIDFINRFPDGLRR